MYFAVLDNSNVDILRYLVSQGANVNAKDDHDNTPLHYTAVANNP